MASTFVTVRGIEHEVIYEDHGYEPDTNAHDIDWYFAKPAEVPELTPEEEEAVLEHLYKLAADYPDYFDDDVF